MNVNVNCSIVKSLNDRISHGTKQEETQIDILKQELSDARAQVLTKEGEVHSLQEQASDLNIQLDSKNEVISKLHSDNDESKSKLLGSIQAC